LLTYASLESGRSASGSEPILRFRRRRVTQTANAIFNSIWTALGTPAVTLPLFKGPSGCRSDCSSLPAASGTGAFSTSEAVMKALG
jgi:hypothetical protein